MSSNVIFAGWNRAVPGREQLAAAHFQEYIQYLTGLQQGGTIDSFKSVLLTAHGGDLNGFFLIEGEPDKLNALVTTEEWLTHAIRAGLYTEGLGIVRGVTGDLLMAQMGMWTANLPD